MKVKYLSYTYAAHLKDKYNYLVGQPYKYCGVERGVICDIVIVPYSKILQWRFLREYAKGIEINPINALGRFDVAVITDQFRFYSQPENFCDLRSYITFHSVNLTNAMM